MAYKIVSVRTAVLTETCHLNTLFVNPFLKNANGGLNCYLKSPFGTLFHTNEYSVLVPFDFNFVILYQYCVFITNG
jgi:hypothetical protein